MSDIAQIRTFLRVVEAGSFSAAGRQLGVAPSSVSRQINELEDSLNVRLLQRSTRKLSLTEAGEVYFKSASQIVLDIDEAALAVSQIDGAPSGILRLNVPASLSRRYIVPALFEFQKQYPAIKVVLTADDQLVDLISSRIDVAIRIGRLQDSSLMARKIGSSRRILCASDKYLKDVKKLNYAQDLAIHNCLTFRSHPGSNIWKFQNENSIEEVKVSGNFFSNDGESLVAAAVSGSGIILVPEWLVSYEMKTGSLQEVLPAFNPVPSHSPLYAIYPKQRHLPSKIREFINYMVNKPM